MGGWQLFGHFGGLLEGWRLGGVARSGLAVQMLFLGVYK